MASGVRAPHLVALVRAGAMFENGVIVERPDESASEAVTLTPHDTLIHSLDYSSGAVRRFP